MLKKIILTLFLMKSAFATGPSRATITLIPIATNEAFSTVLFQTYRNISPGGGYGAKNEAYGWLVVSAVYDIWDEHIALKGDNNDPKTREKLEAYEKGNVNLSHPDKVLKEMMKKYYFDKDSKLVSEKYSVLELKPKQSCYKGKCIDRVLMQKTIEKHRSNNIIDSIRGEEFSFQGVVLLHNGIEYENEDGEGEIIYGGEFSNFENLWNEHDIGYELMSIDALALFDPYIFREPNKKIKKEIEEVVSELVELLKKSDKKSFEIINKKFIHPKYGFYYINIPAGIPHRFTHHKSFNISYLKNRERAWDVIDGFTLNSSYVVPKFKWNKNHFDCETDSWLTTGLVVSPKEYFISKNVYDFKSISQKEKARVSFLAKDSLQVSLSESNLVFEIKKIEGRWYIVLINSAIVDCSV